MAANLVSDQQWIALTERDAGADGQFFYAVRTTGVYCRPSCSARQPLRRNVEIFETTEAAQAAGFRACKRCRPDAPDPRAAQRETIRMACRRIESAETSPSLQELADWAGYSPFHFQRLFKREVGLTPKQYEKAHRERRVRGEIGSSNTITDAIYDAGFQSSAAFYAGAVQMFGMTPTHRRAGGRGETIRFAIGECRLGVVLVAATEAGVCAVSLGDDAAGLLREFQDEFGDAEIVGGDTGFETRVANIIGLIEQPGETVPAGSLELDIRGTAFQKRVWTALTQIAPGDTTNYQSIARAIGQPTAARAVAQACGANRIAVAIPCHRVVRSDGQLSGYRWGIERKRALLEQEGAR